MVEENETHTCVVEENRMHTCGDPRCLAGRSKKGCIVRAEQNERERREREAAEKREADDLLVRALKERLVFNVPAQAGTAAEIAEIARLAREAEAARGGLSEAERQLEEAVSYASAMSLQNRTLEGEVAAAQSLLEAEQGRSARLQMDLAKLAQQLEAQAGVARRVLDDETARAAASDARAAALKVEVEKLTKQLEAQAGVARRVLDDETARAAASDARAAALKVEVETLTKQLEEEAEQAAALSAAESAARAALERRVRELEAQLEQLRPSSDPGTTELATLRRTEYGLIGLRVALLVPRSAMTASFLRVYATPRAWLANRESFAITVDDRRRHGNGTNEAVGAAFVRFLERRLNELDRQPESAQAASQWLKEVVAHFHTSTISP
jgi:chromosome segregation ATPase